MAEEQPSKTERKRERQPISIPFIWEEKPGMPKKDWKPAAQPAKPVAPPTKLVVSVPFGWEEKPGTPIPSIVCQPTVTALAPSQELSVVLSSPAPDTTPAKQATTVPFEGEEKPGLSVPGFVQHPTASTFAPSLEHSVEVSSPMPVAPPVKQVVSVPFGWEEKPGTPIPGFAQPSTYSIFAPPEEHSNVLSSPPSHPNQGNDERDEMSDSESDFDMYSSATDDSFSSAPSLLANCLIATSTLSKAVPANQTCFALTSANGGQLQSPGSPASETDSSTSSYATGTASLVGSSFLEWLFPLLVPNSSFPTNFEKNPSEREDVQVNDFQHERNCSQVRRPLLTLGELIVMSRRRSCQRKVMQKRTSSMDFAKRNAYGCFGSVDSISRLHMKWKRQFQLKLM